MFTGLIEEIGRIEQIEQLPDAARLTVSANRVMQGTQHGDSISVGGVCLTVIDQTPHSFTADVMQQTLTMSTLGSAKPGSAVNLERATTANQRLGGHIVQGHVDGTAEVLSVTPSEDWTVVRISLTDDLAPLVADKGSIAINGVSLTVSSVSDAIEPHQWCEVSLIPETLSATTMGLLAPSDRVNIETDILARHVQRMLAFAKGNS